MILKTLFAFLALQVLHPAAKPQRLQVTAIQQKDLSFPLIQPSQAVAYKINQYLQSQVLDNDVPVTDAAKIFEKSRYIQRKENTQFGYTRISYAVERNNTALLSLSFSFEKEGATTSYSSGYYNFDNQTGDLLAAEKMFTTNGLAEIKKQLIKERNERIQKQLKEYGNRKDSGLVAEQFAACNENADENNFSIREKGIVFCKSGCFPTLAEPYDLDLDIEIPYKKIEKYLTPYGKKLLPEASLK